MSDHILALDQGTTSSRAIVFDREGRIAAMSQHAFTQYYPQDGWVEHDPMEIWETERRAAAEAVAGLPAGAVAGIGVTNQRETTILWDKATGKPVYNAIVWQCRRTAELCEELKRQGLEERIVSTTGLLIDAYFSGTKIRWVLDNVPGVRQRAEKGEYCSAPWRHGSSGSSPVSTSRTTPTPAAPCCSTSTACAGMRSCAAFWACRLSCCPALYPTAWSTAW